MYVHVCSYFSCRPGTHGNSPQVAKGPKPSRKGCLRMHGLHPMQNQRPVHTHATHWTTVPRRTQNTKPGPTTPKRRPPRKERHTRARTDTRESQAPTAGLNERNRPATYGPTRDEQEGSKSPHPTKGFNRNQQQANKEGQALRTNSNHRNDQNIRIRKKSQHDRYEMRQCARKRSRNNTGHRTTKTSESQ